MQVGVKRRLRAKPFHGRRAVVDVAVVRSKHERRAGIPPVLFAGGAGIVFGCNWGRNDITHGRSRYGQRHSHP